MKLKAFACTLLAVVAAEGVAGSPSVARPTTRPVLRLGDRAVSASAPRFSAASLRGQMKAQVAVRVRNLGRRSLAITRSEFAVSAQGDIFRAQAANGGRRHVRIGARRTSVLRLTFALPRAARGQTSLFYRAGSSGRGGSIPLDAAAHPIRRAFSSAITVNTFWATAGVGDPWGTAIDRAGNVWFAEPGCDFAPTCSASARPGQIGEIRASSHAIVFYTLPNISGNQPIFLAFDGSGNLWFTTPNNSMIGEFNPATSQFVGQWPVSAGSGPWDLTFAGGKIWYTEHLVSAVGSFDPSTHAFRDFQTPTANSNPYGIASNGGLVWFTENNSGVDRIASLDTTRNNAISEYPIVRPLSGTPHLVVTDAGGRPWWTEGWSNTIATLNPAAATPGQCGTTSGTCAGIRRFTVPAPGSCSTSGTHASGIAFQPAGGLVWFDNSLTAQVGSFNPSGNTFAMTSLSNCSAHPHDGLNLDATGNVWFDEEFVNAIGELVAGSPAPTGPSVSTGSASAVGTTSATIAGSVNPNGQATTYHFDYGLSTSYGSRAPASPDPSAGSGTTAQPVSANVTGLAPGTTYHYRLVATNVAGTQYGSDQTFATATTSPPMTGAVVAADSFNRSVSGGLGTADVGGPWTLLDTPASWNVTPGSGSVSVAASGQARAVLGSVAVRDVDLLANVALPLCAGGTNCDSFLVGRATAGSTPSYYRIGVVQGGGSSVALRAQRDDGSYLAGDLNTGIPAAAGAVLWIRVQFQGANPTTIRARVWPAGSAEPSTWLLNTTDSSAAEQTAGAIGIRARNEDGSAARTFEFRSFQATALS